MIADSGQPLDKDERRRQRIASLIAELREGRDPISSKLDDHFRLPGETADQYLQRCATQLFRNRSEEDARSCAHCGDPIPPDAPVWRQKLYTPNIVLGDGRPPQVVAFCSTCRSKSLEFGSYECVGCGRQVFYALGQEGHDKGVCSKQCADKAAR